MAKLRVISHLSNIGDTVCNFLYSALKTPRQSEFASLAEKFDRSLWNVIAQGLSLRLLEDYIFIPKSLDHSTRDGIAPYVTRFRPGTDNAEPGKKIFISYRRSDASRAAISLFCRFLDTFGERSVFYDFSAMPLGVPFRNALSSAVSNSIVLVILIGPTWLACRAGSTKSRLFETGDPVRLEIEVALRCKVPIVPVLLGETKALVAADLPPTIRDICNLTFYRLESERTNPESLDGLIERCQLVARNSGLNNTLPMPELTLDALVSIRALCSACLQFRDLWELISENKSEARTLLEQNFDRLLEPDALLQRWGQYIGIDHPDVAHGTRLDERLEGILEATYGKLDDDGWKRLTEPFNENSAGIPSKEQTVAGAIAGMILQVFSIHMRNSRITTTRDDFAATLARLFLRKNENSKTKILLLYTSAETDHAHEELVNYIGRVFGDNLYALDLSMLGHSAIDLEQMQSLCGAICLVGKDFPRAAGSRHASSLLPQMKSTVERGHPILPILLPTVEVPDVDNELITLIFSFTALSMAASGDPIHEMQKAIDAARWIIAPHLIYGEPSLPVSIPLSGTQMLSSLVRAGLHLRSICVDAANGELEPEHLKVLGQIHLAIDHWGVYLGMLEAGWNQPSSATNL